MTLLKGPMSLNYKIEHEITLTKDEHLRSLELSKDKNPIHSSEEAAEKFKQKLGINEEGLILEGAHSIGLLESHPEISNHYILGVSRVSFEYPVVIKDTKKIKYCLERFHDNPFYMYKVSIKDCNERAILTGNIHTTPSYEIFKQITDQKEHTLSEAEKMKIGEIVLDDSKINEYCKTFHIDSESYHKKYGDNISGMMAAFFIPGKLVSLIENFENKTYVYKKQDLDICLKGIGKSELKIYGEIPKPKLGLYKLKVLVKGIEGIIAKSETIAAAF